MCTMFNRPGSFRKVSRRDSRQMLMRLYGELHHLGDAVRWTAWGQTVQCGLALEVDCEVFFCIIVSLFCIIVGEVSVNEVWVSAAVTARKERREVSGPCGTG